MTCADTAKLIRKALTEAFPGVQFSVRSKVYSGGASINVGWTDGPNTKQVEAVAGVFSGAHFDSSIDLKTSTYALVDGQEVRFGADFIFCNRHYSDSFIKKAIDQFARIYAANYRGREHELPSVEDWKNGRLFGRIVPDSIGIEVAREIGRLIEKRSDRLAVKRSPTAAKVIYLGNTYGAQVWVD
jgi:hypothetical protein